MKNNAAIILAAGKGTRMGSAPINKVAFDCAGEPVIRRIVRNMRAGGVTRFVIVVGHHAESVMQALNGEQDVLWAYQAEQRGTGHAAECGLKVLESIGFAGSVLVSMGDKIVSPKIVRELLDRSHGQASKVEAVLGVQRVAGPSSRGHVVFHNGRPVCIVEHKDAVRDNNVEALESPYVNAAFYAFDAAALSGALASLKSDNAQGEFYLTDTIAQFASSGTLEHYVVENSDDMQTYSTRLELRKIAHRFLRRASEIEKGNSLLVAFREKYGDKPCLVASAPGRINLMGRHIEHRGGAGDHAAMKCAREGCITHLKFKPFEIGEVVPFPSDYSVLVVDSGEQAKKSEGARETFNARIRDYETALAEVKRNYPGLPIAYFRDLAFLPERDRAKALACLEGSVKGVATFGINECRRAEDCLALLKNRDYVALGEMMKASHDGDRLGRGEYECSTLKIDALCDRLNATPGVLGSRLVGAGLGGCVIVLIEKPAVDSVLANLARTGFAAFNCKPSPGSRVEY